MILDTSFLIDLMNSNERAIDTAIELSVTDEPQRIPAQAVYELYIGVGYTEQPVEEVEQIRGVLEDRPIVETDDDLAKLAGRLDGELRREGDRVGTSDVIIGAAGLYYSEPVLTGNPDDFERIPDVEVETYS
jgi:predicted nucleic acid-binding protein